MTLASQYLDYLWSDSTSLDPFLLLTRPRSSSYINIDIKEKDNSYEVLADLPGVGKDNIEVYVKKEKLYISAEKSDYKKLENGERFHLSERYSEFISRYVSLPEDADLESIKVKYVDGVLSVSVNKNSKNLTKRFAIE